eukprot:TRINITY_DN12864_c0_g1_i1.p1 TRINITY_DN12864_c0_g1~~TRINITY_DN12864_c0_g1_i1.p1  ORF type:complete len:607 (+),score=123.46 TRINITY_DN12864_c0_g1_i1:56-1822(+)
MSHNNRRHKNQKKNVNTFIQKAAQFFDCSPKQLSVERCVDPFNQGNTLKGVLCRANGPFCGSVLFMELNGGELSAPQMIYGVPNLDSVKTVREIEGVTQIYLANKWNGMPVIVFKYFDEQGNCFVSARPRFSMFLQDKFGTETIKMVKNFFGIEMNQSFSMDSLSGGLAPILAPEIQSLTFEMCGRDQCSLVQYTFDLDLKPLFTTSVAGLISPIVWNNDHQDFTELFSLSDEFHNTDKDDLQQIVDRLESDFGPVAFNSKDVNDMCFLWKRTSFAVNEHYRELNSLSSGYFYNRFAIEGKVLYLLDSNFNVINRSSMFKVKSKDIYKSHHAIWDVVIEGLSLEALDKLFQKNMEVNPSNMRSELDISEKAWRKFEGDIMKLVTGIPNPYEEREGNLHMVVMMGIPGSGKSTISYALEELGWVRVNQDDLGNRKACERLAKSSLRAGKSVVIDRCNFDVPQRATWVKMAGEFNVSTIRLVHLDIDPEICKERVGKREDHPTIKDGELGAQIIDKFMGIRVYPVKAEGFKEIITLSTSDECPGAIEHITSQVTILPNGFETEQTKEPHATPSKSHTTKNQNPFALLDEI